MPTNKSPGMDGLTMEFYRTFWDILGPDLATVWAESLQGGVLPLSCRRAVLAFLPKKGDLLDLQNWHPVSLLSTDYKIVVKAISLRLGSVMADVIHPDQTYTVPGCSIFDNLFLVRDLLELGRREGLSFALLSLDQEKVFDRVDHGYLLGTLQAFGFGPQFVSFLQVLYTSAECLVRLNWTLTEPVSFRRGVRQGCPLSDQLYALAIEPFLCLLRRRLTELVLWEPELGLVLSAYADDVLLVVQDPGDLAGHQRLTAELQHQEQGESLPPGCPEPGASSRSHAAALSRETIAQKLEGKSLANKMCLDTLGEYVGQHWVLGEQTLLLSHLGAHEISSFILWAP
ncbi:unnamed protein product [Caretta caretta]